MKLNVSPELWGKFAGEWYFSIYMDYRLELSYDADGLGVRVYDITDPNHEEECELNLMSVNREYLSFWMSSSSMYAKISLFCDVNDRSMLVEFTDYDVYDKIDPIAIPEENQVLVECDATELPDWIYGTWATGFGDEFIHLESCPDGLAIGIWRDVTEGEPQSGERDYDFDRIEDVYFLDTLAVGLTVKGVDENNVLCDTQLFFDSHKKQVRLVFSRMRPAYKSLEDLRKNAD